MFPVEVIDEDFLLSDHTVAKVDYATVGAGQVNLEECFRELPLFGHHRLDVDLLAGLSVACVTSDECKSLSTYT